MLETGFLSAALAFVGILPAREIEMTPMPVIGADRPTTTESPQQDVASMPVELIEQPFPSESHGC